MALQVRQVDTLTWYCGTAVGAGVNAAWWSRGIKKGWGSVACGSIGACEVCGINRLVSPFLHDPVSRTAGARWSRTAGAAIALGALALKGHAVRDVSLVFLCVFLSARFDSAVGCSRPVCCNLDRYVAMVARTTCVE